VPFCNLSASVLRKVRKQKVKSFEKVANGRKILEQKGKRYEMIDFKR
jgi:hypothetical protein